MHWIIMSDYLWVGNRNTQVQGRHLKCGETKMRTNVSVSLFIFTWYLCNTNDTNTSFLNVLKHTVALSAAAKHTVLYSDCLGTNFSFNSLSLVSVGKWLAS